jgi:hypothetical protein
MTMLSQDIAQAPLQSQQRIHDGFARVLARLIMIVEVFAESQELARAAHKRYPFAEW